MSRTIPLNLDLTGYDSARSPTGDHHRIARHLSSPFLFGPPISDDLLELVTHVFNEEEAALVRHLPPLRPRRARAVSRRTGRPVEEVRRVLDHVAFHKSAILAWGEPRKYTIMPLIPGMFEIILMTADLSTRTDWHRRFAEIFERIWESGFLRDYAWSSRATVRYLPVQNAGKTLQNAWPSDHLEEVLEPYREFAVGQCQCRLAMHLVDRGCEHALENCTAFGPIAPEMVKRGLMRPASREEIIAVKRQAEEAGCVTFVGNVGGGDTNNASCSCCPCCCHALRAISQFNVPSLTSRPHFLPSRDTDTCTDCGKCARICPTGAWSLTEGDDTLHFDARRCIGCGLCQVHCPTGAITLQDAPARRPERSQGMLVAKAMPGLLVNGVRVSLRRAWGDWSGGG